MNKAKILIVENYEKLIKKLCLNSNVENEMNMF